MPPPLAKRRKLAEDIWVSDGVQHTITGDTLSMNREGSVSPQMCVDSDDEEPPLLPHHHDHDDAGEWPQPDQEPPQNAEEQERYQNSDLPFLTWLEFSDAYLDSMLRLAGRGRYIGSVCAGCSAKAPSFRCTECYGREMVCSGCMVDRHARVPLHKIERFKHESREFEGTTLADLGMTIQLGHPAGQPCPFPSAAHKNFTLLDTESVQTVNLFFCNCKDKEHWVQLMEEGWWPATPLEPQSAATVKLLRHCHNQILTSNITIYDYWRALETSMGHTGLEKIKERAAALSLMIKEYRSVQSFKRAGRGHDPTGIEGTAEGELALLCTACPIDGVNLPEGWADAPDDILWKYRAYYGMDANFKHLSRWRSSFARDPGTTDGLAFFVKQKPYADFLLSITDEDEISHCSGFAALTGTLTKKVKGLRSRGIAAVSCRHEFFIPNAVGDLQVGERFANMQYLFASALNHPTKRELRGILSSYDVNCLFWVRFWERMNQLPLHLQASEAMKIDHKVPRMHLYAHKEECQSAYALHYTRYAGMMDGEHVERLWSLLNYSAASAREQGPGTRIDSLNDQMNASNYRKSLDMGNTLLRKMYEAIPLAVMHRRDFERFDAVVRNQRPQQVSAWETMLAKFEKDPRNAESPYEIPSAGKAKADLRLRHAEAATKKAAAGGALKDITPENFVLGTIEFKEKQRQLREDVRKIKNPTTVQLANLEERRAGLTRLFVGLREEQAVHMPGLRSFVDIEEAGGDTHIEKVTLWLPSDFGRSQRARDFMPNLPTEFKRIRAACQAAAPGLAEIEDEIRWADAADALDDLRRHLRCRQFLNRWKVKNIEGQRRSVRIGAAQTSVDVKVFVAKNRYRASYDALLSLRGPGEWQQTYGELLDEDVRALNERELSVEEKKERLRLRELTLSLERSTIEEVQQAQHEARMAAATDAAAAAPTASTSKGVENDGEEGEYEEEEDRGEPTASEGAYLFGVVDHGEGRRRLSWIWLVGMGASYDPNEKDEDRRAREESDMHDALRVEWAKAKARGDRWVEWVYLIYEEMRRVLEASEKNEAWWKVQGARRQSALPPGEFLDRELQEGLDAYANKRATTERRRRALFTEKWATARAKAEMLMEKVAVRASSGVPVLNKLRMDLGLDDTFTTWKL